MVGPCCTWLCISSMENLPKRYRLLLRLGRAKPIGGVGPVFIFTTGEPMFRIVELYSLGEIHDGRPTTCSIGFQKSLTLFFLSPSQARSIQAEMIGAGVSISTDTEWPDCECGYQPIFFSFISSLNFPGENIRVKNGCETLRNRLWKVKPKSYQ
jgi:hypothetical protein